MRRGRQRQPGGGETGSARPPRGEPPGPPGRGWGRKGRRAGAGLLPRCVPGAGRRRARSPALASGATRPVILHICGHQPREELRGEAGGAAASSTSSSSSSSSGSPAARSNWSPALRECTTKQPQRLSLLPRLFSARLRGQLPLAGLGWLARRAAAERRAVCSCSPRTTLHPLASGLRGRAGIPATSNCPIIKYRSRSQD